MDKLLYGHTMEYSSAVTMKKLELHESTQMTFTNIILGDKSNYTMKSFILGIKYTKQYYTLLIWLHRYGACIKAFIGMIETTFREGVNFGEEKGRVRLKEGSQEALPG